MNKIEVNIPKSVSRVKIIHSNDLISVKSNSVIPVLESRDGDNSDFANKFNRNFKLEDIDDSLLDEIFEEFDDDNKSHIEKKQKKNDFETEYFTKIKFSNLNKPVQIDLKKVESNNLLFNEINSKVQLSYQQGVEFGKDVTAATFNKEINSMQEWLRQFDTVTQDMRIQLTQLFGRIENTVSDLAIIIAKHILGHEVSQNSNLFIEQARKAIASIDNEIILKIHLHPDNVEILKNVKSSLLDDATKLENVIIASDISVDKGGCIVETNVGMIDARVDTQLEKLRESLESVVNAKE